MSRKASWAFWRVGRNPQHGGPAFSKCARQPGEVDGLLGAARGVRAGIEKQHQFLAREVAQRNGLAAVTRQPEGGCLCTLGDSGLPDRRRGGFSGNGLLAGAFPDPGFAAVAFAAAVARGAAAARPGGFNGFDGALGAAFGVALPAGLPAFLPGLPDAALRTFAAGVLTAATDLVRAAFPAGDLGDFLRVFLDIRLPFVAFGGSIIRVLRVVSWQARIESDRWANLMASE